MVGISFEWELQLFIHKQVKYLKEHHHDQKGRSISVHIALFYDLVVDFEQLCPKLLFEGFFLLPGPFLGVTPSRVVLLFLLTQEVLVHYHLFLIITKFEK